MNATAQPPSQPRKPAVVERRFRHAVYRTTRPLPRPAWEPVEEYLVSGTGVDDPALRWYLGSGIEQAREVATAPRIVPPHARLLFLRGTASLDVIGRADWRRIRILDPQFFGHCETSTGGSLQFYDEIGAAGRRSVIALGQDRYRSMIAELGGAADACVVATGPSLQQVDPGELRAFDVRVLCNSAVRDRELLMQVRPNVFAFGDAAFHYGPSPYAHQFRTDLRWMIEEVDPWIVTGAEFLPLLRQAFPDRLLSKVVGVDLQHFGGESHDGLPTHRRLANVLLTYMLPAAAALARRLALYGCDGRDPSDSKYWAHNSKTQYDDLYSSVMEMHPSFFRDVDYEAYYRRHCRRLEAELKKYEADGVTFFRGTPSHIPAIARLADLGGSASLGGARPAT